MEKVYKSVTDMLKGLDVEKQFVEQVKEEIEERNLIKLLIALRCKAGITQKQLSKKMHCGQSRISKIENAKDRNLSLGDILDYAGALGLNVELSLMDTANEVLGVGYYCPHCGYFVIRCYADEVNHIDPKNRN